MKVHFGVEPIPTSVTRSLNFVTWRNQHADNFEWSSPSHVASGIPQSFHRFQIKRKNVVKSPDNGNCIFPIHRWTRTVYACMHSAQVLGVCVWMKCSLASTAVFNMQTSDLVHWQSHYYYNACMMVSSSSSFDIIGSNIQVIKMIGGKSGSFQMFRSLARLLWMENLFHLPLTITCWLVVYDFVNRSHAFPHALTGIWILAKAFNRFNSFYYQQNGCVAQNGCIEEWW